MRYMLDTDAISALVHHRRGFERLAGRLDGLAIADRLVSAVTMSEIETMIARATNPQAKLAKVRLGLRGSRRVHAGHIRASLEPRGLGIGPMHRGPCEKCWSQAGH